jgi:hypothetical protein
MTVVANADNELIPQRTVTGYRMCKSSLLFSHIFSPLTKLFYFNSYSQLTRF